MGLAAGWGMGQEATQEGEGPRVKQQVDMDDVDPVNLLHVALTPAV